ncbi:TetR family transcriptional regulator [Ancylobacter sonchi]|uniref:TetR/AcrR family transcriptional regulator n=1 Tax=Ancylobacter sonchi TaxID=1937790 RepID=UPI001BD2A78F|nr:TetR/AcrR family transcriptional regulator [Ancylobacter sonchi]MBS7537090.1 TetR family transcriptional regulator [Ancylobacter sonchi]
MDHSSSAAARMTVQSQSSSRRQDGSEGQREILAAAQKLFTTIGYRKTTVADIAAELGMSPANVYRFFDSKKSINEGVAELLLDGIVADLAVIAASTARPSTRLAEFLRTLARLSDERFMTNSRVNDMVEDAMTESWSVCVRYAERVQAMVARIVEDGRVSGEFSIEDAAIGAGCVKVAMTCFMHPTMMALSTDFDRPGIEEVIAFILRGLGQKAAG